MAMKAKHAFGNSSSIESAKQANKIDAFDILFLDGDTEEPKVGWLDSQGKTVIVNPYAEVAKLETQVETKLAEKANAEDVEALETELATKANAAEVEAAISAKADASDVEALETELATKVTAEEVDAKVETAVAEIEAAVEKIDYEISHKPDGTLVDYRDKEIRVMIPADTQFELQNSGENADANLYYIGFKAYAPSDDVVNFKEDLAEVISDETMYSFEGNEFAGIDEDGRKYSIVWLPVAAYDGSAWAYYGAGSVKGKYIGWYYSVEWYDANSKVVDSDCIRINLSNEDCHSYIKPYYMSDVMTEVETLIEEKITEIESGNEIIEF